MERPVRFLLRVMAPLHIGCDEVFEPMAFRVDEAKKRLIWLDPLEFCMGLEPREMTAFADICRKGTIASIIEVYKFMGTRRFDGEVVGLCDGFVEHYRKTLGMSTGDTQKLQRELNKFVIARTSFLPDTNRPYIPGSSIKGALRTAHLNSRAALRSLPTPKGKGAAKVLEETLLDGGSFDTDPFRMVKVSDFLPVGEVKTTVLYGVNRKKKPSRFEARGPYQILEVIEPGSLFMGWISVQEPHHDSGIKTPVSLERLRGAATHFYSKEMSRENGDLAAIGARPVTAVPEHDGFLLRLGRHSGAECVTIEGHREIRIMQGKGQPAKMSPNATTLWLAAETSNPKSNSGLRPCGWVVVTPLTDESEDELRRKEEEYRQRGKGSRVRPDSFPVETQSQGEVAQKAHPPSTPGPPSREIWDMATLTWNPGSRTVIASRENKKATTQQKELVPEALGRKLFDKKKSVLARVEVEEIGKRYYKITAIMPES